MFASALTVAALPAVWLVNREDDGSARPSVAAVGPDLGEAAGSPTPQTVDPMGAVAPRFLDATGTVAVAAGPVTPVIGTGEGAVLATGTAIFRRAVTDAKTCWYSGLPRGTHVVVVNVANDRSVDCWTAPRAMDQPQRELVMSASGFEAIADPTAAPIHVEIREP